VDFNLNFDKSDGEEEAQWRRGVEVVAAGVKAHVGGRGAGAGRGLTLGKVEVLLNSARKLFSFSNDNLQYTRVPTKPPPPKKKIFQTGHSDDSDLLGHEPGPAAWPGRGAG
jgi:hypothetical protein